MIIFECSSQSFHASFETFSKTRLPSSPVQGTRSSPGISFPNFTQWTMRVPGLTGSFAAGAGPGPQESFAIVLSSRIAISPYCKLEEFPSGGRFCAAFLNFRGRTGEAISQSLAHRDRLIIRLYCVQGAQRKRERNGEPEVLRSWPKSQRYSGTSGESFSQTGGTANRAAK